MKEPHIMLGFKKPKENMNKYFIIMGILAVLILILIFTVYSLGQTKMVLASKVKSQAVLIKNLETPKYDELNDFLTEQCNSQGVYCVSTETSNPSLEILKFLVNFRELPGNSYRLFFEVSVGGKGEEFPYQLKCNGVGAEFYVCQEVTATRPTDVIRVFEPSFRTLSKNATYHFNLMVKPVGEIEHTDTITLKPNPNLKVQENLVLIEQKKVDSVEQEKVEIVNGTGKTMPESENLEAGVEKP